MAKGQCLCGSVRYVVDGPLGDVRLCYCESCRRASGSAFSANARVPVDRFRWLAGEELLREHESSRGVSRVFCSRCGSPVCARVAADPTTIRIRLGGLSGTVDAVVVAHVWVSEKPTWYRIEDDLPQHAQGAAT